AGPNSAGERRVGPTASGAWRKAEGCRWQCDTVFETSAGSSPCRFLGQPGPWGCVVQDRACRSRGILPCGVGEADGSSSCVYLPGRFAPNSEEAGGSAQLLSPGRADRSELRQGPYEPGQLSPRCGSDRGCDRVLPQSAGNRPQLCV